MLKAWNEIPLDTGEAGNAHRIAKIPIFGEQA